MDKPECICCYTICMYVLQLSIFLLLIYNDHECKILAYELNSYANIFIIQWNLGIRDTQGTVKNCPEF